MADDTDTTTASTTPAPKAALNDKPIDAAAVSFAPPRPHDALVSALDLRWSELKAFVADLVGDVDGELGDVLTFIRSKL